MPDETPKGIDRRTLFKLAGAAGVLAGCSPAPGPQKLVPYLVPPEEIVPGTPVFYRTVCRECSAACGVTARTREGRVVKLEGNPDDPVGRGALCARGQAALQGLYAPERFRGPARRSQHGRLESVGWDEAEGALADALVAARSKGSPPRVWLVTRPEPGAAGALQKEFMAKLGCGPGQRVVLEPFDHAPLREAGRVLFGRAELPSFDLGQARTVVSFGADFAETWLSPVELARQLASGRGRVDAERTRLVWIGARLCLTGVSADRWLKVRAGGEPWVALALLRFLCDPQQGVRDLAPEASAVFAALALFDPDEAERLSGVPRAAIAALGAELSRRRPSALLGPGLASSGPHATELAVAIQLINYLLGNVGRTVLFGLDPLADPPSRWADLRALVSAAAAGEVDVLLVHHADPCGTLPAALAAGAALARIPMVVSFSSLPDETTELAHLVLPDDHPLESFGDVSARRNVVALAQPAMTRLWDTRSSSQVLIEVAAKLPAPATPLPYDDFYSFVQSRLGTLLPGLAGEELDAAQRAARRTGVLVRDALPQPVTVRLPDLRLLRPAPLPPAAEDALDLVVFPTAARGDGRGATLPWLRELPDVLTNVSWTAWAELAPATAKRLGLEDGDVVTVATPAGRATLPVCVFEGLCEDVIAVPLGPEALGLLAAEADAATGAPAWQAGLARVARTGRRVTLPRLTATPYEAGRTIVRTVTVAAPAVPQPPAVGKMHPPPAFPVHRWAMAIDTDRCTGCQACVVACYAENNVPVVGPEAMARGRNMAWLRIEHFVRVDADATRVDLLPMLCQQCGNAPCETVCPVYATYTTPEGLNAQVYNRCVGTRYCSNNCPYKVRVFNWRDPDFPAPLTMQLNPDVTVRSKGVMEKCTFCVQRIRFGENAARDERRPARDGEIVPACAQTCPAQAIVFGDADDPNSRVAALQRDRRGYNVLGELNTLPAVTYLARVRDEGS